MADVATDLTPLYNPVPAPAPLGESTGGAPYKGGFTPAQEAMTKSISGGGGGEPFGDPNAQQHQLPFGNMPMIATEDFANVGGVTGAAPIEDTATVIPQLATEKAVEDAYEGQVSEFHEAAEGIDANFLSTFRVGKRNLEDGKVTGKAAAKIAKRQDRRGDRDARKEAGLKGSEKRQMRRAQRGQRKSAWKDYKGESDLAATEQAAQLELL
tara:strand:+ start:114 stop:746 length:633 start_codon:yes stop_codon:yes gene_type:complete